MKESWQEHHHCHMHRLRLKSMHKHRHRYYRHRFYRHRCNKHKQQCSRSRQQHQPELTQRQLTPSSPRPHRHPHPTEPHTPHHTSGLARTPRQILMQDLARMMRPGVPLVLLLVLLPSMQGVQQWQASSRCLRGRLCRRNLNSQRC